MNFFKWFSKISPYKASDPNPSPCASNSSNDNFHDDTIHTIEMSVEVENIIGSCLNIGIQDSIGRGAKGQLVRFRKSISVLCGCGHPVSQLHAENESGKSSKRGLAGKCFYCSKELQKSMIKGLISEMEAERLSLVCTDCARITISGVLCCPRHFAAIEDEKGNTVYIGPEEIVQQDRKETVKKILAPFAALFSEHTQPQLPQSKTKHE